MELKFSANVQWKAGCFYPCAALCFTFSISVHPEYLLNRGLQEH